MKNVLIIGSGISGLSCAIKCAAHGMRATILSPYPSERAQSVMAAGGINAVTDVCEADDSVQKHIEDTLKGGAYIGGESAVTGLCSHYRNRYHACRSGMHGNTERRIKCDLLFSFPDMEDANGK